MSGERAQVFQLSGVLEPSSTGLGCAETGLGPQSLFGRVSDFISKACSVEIR